MTKKEAVENHRKMWWWIAIENPIGYMNTHYRKPDQIIHPY